MRSSVAGRGELVLVLVLLVALSAQIWVHIQASSPTFDEPYHMARSYVYLRTGDQALLARGGHPPLSNLLSVAPLLLRADVKLPASAPGWPDVRAFKDLFTVADAFMWRLGNDVDGLMLWSRLPGLFLSVLLGLMVFLWSRQLFGATSALVSLGLYAFDPNMVAHSGLVTTDLGGTLFIFLSLFCLWWFCQGPSWRRLVLTGMVFGMAQASKFTALYLIPLFVLLLVVWVVGRPDEVVPDLFSQRRVMSKRARQAWFVVAACAVLFTVGALTVWAVYAFDVRPLLPREDSHPVLDRFIPAGSPVLKSVVYAVAENTPLFAPSYWSELAWLRSYAAAGHASFLLGDRALKGWWYYFPLAFAIKTPIPTLLLLVLATAMSLLNGGRWRDVHFLWMPIVGLAVTSLASSIDIGYRNILPILPLTFVFVGQVAILLRRRWARTAMTALAIWLVLGTVRLAPHYLAYFNELIGGPANGYHYLVDSNLDWGQDLKTLKKYVEAKAIHPLYLSYFGSGDPAYYGLDVLPVPNRPPSADAEPAYYAISATNLQFAYGSAADKPHWLSGYQPLDSVGYSILIYQVPQ